MTILGLLNALLSLASAVAGYLHDRQLMDAGEAKATLRALKEAQDATIRAKAIAERVRSMPDDDLNSVLRDDADKRP